MTGGASATYDSPWHNAQRTDRGRTSPCDWLRDDSEHGLRATLKRIAELLENGKFLY